MREIKRIACVGAGLIGQGWATVFAAKGYEVVLQDASEAVLEKAPAAIARNIELLESCGIAEQGTAGPSMARIRTTTRLAEAVSQADYVQESVPDRYEVKKPVFREMDRASAGDAILASSSSGLLMTEIQQETLRPGRCVMVHPMLPVYLVPAVEVVGGAQTSPETTLAACELMKKVGKIPILLKKEVSGYIVNRLQAALLREAIDLVAKGVASAEDVDKAFCMGNGLRDPFLGPLLRAHLAGNGIEPFLRDYADSYRLRWESMECWTSVPPAANRAVVEGVKAMPLVHGKSIEEIKAWRDGMLIRILQAVMQGGGEMRESMPVSTQPVEIESP